MQDPYPIPPFTFPVNGSVTLPGSKSITNRALIIAALADGPTVLENCLFSEDTEIMIKALQALGFEVQPDQGARRIRVEGRGGDIPAKEANLFVGNSGTSARFLTAFCCLSKSGRYTLDGVPQMRRRPIADLAEALNALGASVCATDGFAPLTIEARGLRGGRATIDAKSSSQFISALLMIAPYAEQGMEIRLADASVRRGYIDMTLTMLRQFGYPAKGLESSRDSYLLAAAKPYQAMPSGYHIEGDASAASYFFALPVAIGGSIEINGVTKDSLQGDIAFAQRMEEAGAKIEWKERSALCSFDRSASSPRALQGSFYAFSDTFLTAAALAPRLSGTTSIEEIAHTRHQECDRIEAMSQGLRRAGQAVSETEGSIEIRPQALTSATVMTFDDHRVAMSFAVLGCVDARGDGQPWLRIENPECCKKTFPNFFQVLENLREQSATATAHA